MHSSPVPRFDWEHYLRLAHELEGTPQNPSNQEAKLRASISRAYYAAFCQARNHRRDVDQIPIPPKVNVHRWVQDEFIHSTNQTRKRIGQTLKRLRADRNRADYDDYVPNLQSTAQSNLTFASQVLTDLNTI